MVPWRIVIKQPKSKNLVLLEEKISNETHDKGSNETIEDKSLNTPVIGLKPSLKDVSETQKLEKIIVSKPSESTAKMSKSLPVNKSIKMADSQKINKGADAKELEETQSSQKSHGFLYRLNIEVDEVSTITESVARKILSLGGKKAGRVKLGWKKNRRKQLFSFYFT